MTLRDFLEAELENRQSVSGSRTDYVKEAEGALAEFDALRAELAKMTAERDGYRDRWMPLVLERDAAREALGDVVKHLHRLSLATQNSATTKEGIGFEIRALIAKAKNQ